MLPPLRPGRGMISIQAGGVPIMDQFGRFCRLPASRSCFGGYGKTGSSQGSGRKMRRARSGLIRSRRRRMLTRLRTASVRDLPGAKPHLMGRVFRGPVVYHPKTTRFEPCWAVWSKLGDQCQRAFCGLLIAAEGGLPAAPLGDSAQWGCPLPHMSGDRP